MIFFFIVGITENGKSIPVPIAVHQNGDSLDAATTSDESNQGPLNNGKSAVLDEDTTTSYTEDSLDKPTFIAANEETNDSVISDSTNDSSSAAAPDYNNKRSLDDDSNNSEDQPSSKRIKDKWRLRRGRL